VPRWPPAIFGEGNCVLLQISGEPCEEPHVQKGTFNKLVKLIKDLGLEMTKDCNDKCLSPNLDCPEAYGHIPGWMLKECTDPQYLSGGDCFSIGTIFAPPAGRG
jgi:hypothetical protein